MYFLSINQMLFSQENFTLFLSHSLSYLKKMYLSLMIYVCDYLNGIYEIRDTNASNSIDSPSNTRMGA